MKNWIKRFRKPKVPVVRAGDVIHLEVSGRVTPMSLSSATFHRTERASALFLEVRIND